MADDTEEISSTPPPFRNKKINEVIQRWSNTNLEHIITPILTFVEQHPVGALFLLVFGSLVAIPLICCLIVIVVSLIAVLCGSLVVFGTLFSIAFSCISIYAFGAGVASIAITSAIVTMYNMATGAKSIFAETKC